MQGRAPVFQLGFECGGAYVVHMSDTVSHSLEIAAEMKERNKKVHEEKMNLI